MRKQLLFAAFFITNCLFSQDLSDLISLQQMSLKDGSNFPTSNGWIYESITPHKNNVLGEMNFTKKSMQDPLITDAKLKLSYYESMIRRVTMTFRNTGLYYKLKDQIQNYGGKLLLETSFNKDPMKVYQNDKITFLITYHDPIDENENWRGRVYEYYSITIVSNNDYNASPAFRFLK